MTVTQTLIITIIGSSAFSTFVNQIFESIRKKREDNNGLNKGMRLILKDRIKYLCCRYIEQGWIYADELDDLIAMHDCYHTKLKGNGFLDSLMDKVKSLEIRNP